jgi:uncharacterized MnhB-related membrane protein
VGDGLVISQALLTILLIVFLVVAALHKNVMKATISLAIGSIILSMIFFNFKAPYAAAFELSVGAGLITVLLMTTIALVRPEREGENR